MNIPNKKYTMQFYDTCIDNGYKKVGINLYRCYGENMLQVITFPGPRTLIGDSLSFEPSVIFGVFSLYAQLPWIPPHIMPNCALSVRFQPQIAFENIHFTGTADAFMVMLDKGLLFLDQLTTHRMLSDFLEQYDLLTLGSIVVNDSNKIVPYIQSGQLEKAVNTISAIEKQNWTAFLENSKNPNYDQLTHKEKIKKRLTPLLLLRDSIIENNTAKIQKYLSHNFAINCEKLKDMGVSVDATEDSGTIFW